MRFRVDECTGPAVARWLRSESHEDISVYEESPGVSDDEVLHKAHSELWILITNDKDLGEMIYRQQKSPCCDLSATARRTGSFEDRCSPTAA